MAMIHREYRKKEPTSVHTGMADYIKKTTGYDADVETIKLAFLLAPQYRSSEENDKRKAKIESDKAKAAQAVIDARLAREQDVINKRAAKVQERANRLRAQLAELEGTAAPTPRKVAAKAAPAAPAKVTPRRIAKAAPAKVAPVVPLKRVAPEPVAFTEPTEDRGALREAEDDGFENVEDY